MGFCCCVTQREIVQSVCCNAYVNFAMTLVFVLVFGIGDGGLQR
jgi:hypothetical protein